MCKVKDQKVAGLSSTTIKLPRLGPWASLLTLDCSKIKCTQKALLLITEQHWAILILANQRSARFLWSTPKRSPSRYKWYIKNTSGSAQGQMGAADWPSCWSESFGEYIYSTVGGEQENYNWQRTTRWDFPLRMRLARPRLQFIHRAQPNRVQHGLLGEAPDPLNV